MPLVCSGPTGFILSLIHILRQVETLRPHLILFLSGCTLALGCGVVCLGWRRRALPARAWAASLTGRIWLEAKLLVWAVGLFCLWVWQAVYLSLIHI